MNFSFTDHAGQYDPDFPSGHSPGHSKEHLTPRLQVHLIGSSSFNDFPGIEVFEVPFDEVTNRTQSASPSLVIQVLGLPLTYSYGFRP